VACLLAMLFDPTPTLRYSVFPTSSRILRSTFVTRAQQGLDLRRSTLVTDCCFHRSCSEFVLQLSYTVVCDATLIAVCPISTALSLLVLCTLVLQSSIFAGYFVLGVFYLCMLLQLFSAGCHALLLAALLSISVIVLVATLLVRSYTSHVPQNHSPIPCFIRAPCL
jgi:hypothetical protein